MNKTLFLSVLTSLLLQGCVSSKRFYNTTLVETTPLKHQKYTGQCWSFASTSLLEAESMRLGYEIPELSSFYFVYLNYLDNAEDWKVDVKLSKEFETLGFYISDHPLNQYKSLFNKYNIINYE